MTHWHVYRFGEPPPGLSKSSPPIADESIANALAVEDEALCDVETIVLACAVPWQCETIAAGGVEQFLREQFA